VSEGGILKMEYQDGKRIIKITPEFIHAIKDLIKPFVKPVITGVTALIVFFCN